MMTNLNGSKKTNQNYLKLGLVLLAKHFLW